MKRRTRKPTGTSMTPISAVTGGLIAGAAGTLAMDLLLFARYRTHDGHCGFRDWELSSDLQGWESAPAPAHVGKRLVEGLFQVELPDRRARLVNNITHWGYGIFSGAQYGILAGSMHEPKVRNGLAFGAGVWLTGYVVLPAAKLYEPIWKYDRQTLANDLTAHLVYGMGTAAAFALWVRGGRRD